MTDAGATRNVVTRLEQLERVARLALECRAAQISYFRQRSQEHLLLAKEIERRLDQALSVLDGA